MAGSSRYTVILDANVLYPNLLRDILLSLATAGLYHARWTEKISQEWSTNLATNRPDIESKIPQLIALINAAVPDCLVENYEVLIESLNLPDSDDRHVLAAAIAGHADAIVTSNLKDFPASVLKQYDLEAQHPDDFNMNQFELLPFEALGVMKKIRARMKNPSLSASELIQAVERSGLPQTVKHLQTLADFL